MNTALRMTGVNVLGDMPWGSHVCMFYESKDDLLDTVVPFFKTGLESNEFCLWAPSEPLTLEEARMALSRRIPAFDRHLAAGNMEIVPGREWYLKGDQFDLKRIIQRLGREIARRVGQRLRRNEGERQRVLAEHQPLEGLLRLRARAQQVASGASR